MIVRLPEHLHKVPPFFFFSCSCCDFWWGEKQSRDFFFWSLLMVQKPGVCGRIIFSSFGALFVAPCRGHSFLRSWTRFTGAVVVSCCSWRQFLFVGGAVRGAGWGGWLRNVFDGVHIGLRYLCFGFVFCRDRGRLRKSNLRY